MKIVGSVERTREIDLIIATDDSQGGGRSHLRAFLTRKHKVTSRPVGQVPKFLEGHTKETTTVVPLAKIDNVPPVAAKIEVRRWQEKAKRTGTLITVTESPPPQKREVLPEFLARRLRSQQIPDFLTQRAAENRRQATITGEPTHPKHYRNAIRKSRENIKMARGTAPERKRPQQKGRRGKRR